MLVSAYGPGDNFMFVFIINITLKILSLFECSLVSIVCIFSHASHLNL